MRLLIIIFVLTEGLSLHAQESTTIISLDSITNIIVQAHSNFGVESPFVVETADSNKLALAIKSTSKTTISEVEESFVFDLNDVADVFSIPMGASEFRVIVGLKKKVLITKKTIEYENLFHDEITTEDIREEIDLWFVFTEESKAEKFEKAILQLKKQLTQQ